MAVVETILFLDGEISTLNTAASITSSANTASGYSAEYLREANYAQAWKPIDGTGDYLVEIDTGATVGANGQTAYVVVAYDAKGANQTQLRIIGDDTGAGPWTQRALFTLNTTGPTLDYLSWAVDATPDRHFRIEQLNAARGGGTKTAKVYYWDVFAAAGVFNLDTKYTPKIGAGTGYLNQVASVGAVTTSGGFLFTNRAAKPRQEVELTVKPAEVTPWKDIRDQLHALNGMHKAFAIQFEGLKNAAKANFQLVRVAGPRWTSQRPYRDIYDTSVPLMTEAYF